MSAGIVGLSLAAPAAAQQAPPAAQAAPPTAASTPVVVRPRYAIEIDIVEAEGTCPNHKAGQKIAYPADAGKICPWLMDSMSGAIRVLEYGGTLQWLYKGTPYEKVIDPNGLTTEFIRCPDPSRAVVAKISRRRV
ncbi:MAG: TIGR04076 family protein [Acidobacteria bacterium]|nr:TIGR04076 family protein [Acidobacteriota bacterium]